MTIFNLRHAIKRYIAWSHTWWFHKEFNFFPLRLIFLKRALPSLSLVTIMLALNGATRKYKVFPCLCLSIIIWASVDEFHIGQSHQCCNLLTLFVCSYMCYFFFWLLTYNELKQYFQDLICARASRKFSFAKIAKGSIFSFAF